MNDTLGLTKKPVNSIQPSNDTSNQDMALRERRKKARKPLTTDEAEEPTNG